MFLMAVLGVTLTCLMLFARSSAGVVGIDGSSLSRFGLLGLLTIGTDVCIVAGGFGVLIRGRRRIDLNRSNFLGLVGKSFVDSDLVIPLNLFIVADLVKRRGAVILCFEGEWDNAGIWLCCLTLAARAREACVGVVIELRID
jgi:hypothetical protein